MGDVVHGKFSEARLAMLEMLVSEILRLHGADTLRALVIRMDSRLEKQKGNKALLEAWEPWSVYLLQRMDVMDGDTPPPDGVAVQIDVREMPTPLR